MDVVDPMIEQQDYEERRRWLHSLYCDQAATSQPGPLLRLVKRTLFVLGRILMSLGAYLQSHNNSSVSSPLPK